MWNRLIQFLIIYSVVMYFVEVEVTDLEYSSGFFLWNERVVALVFTVEYFVRWYYAEDRKKYPYTWAEIIDIVAVLPFWAGFFVSVSTLKWVRTLRLLRLFKLNRYNDALTHLTNAFYKTRHEMLLMGFICVIVVAFGSVAIFEAEHNAQPDKFSHLSDGVWYAIVTMTTVGYGDLAPVTLFGRAAAILIMMCGIGIFGTFVSLLGAALVEEFRNERKKLEQHRETTGA
jgi:voltage-gated potassium channel